MTRRRHRFDSFALQCFPVPSEQTKGIPLLFPSLRSWPSAFQGYNFIFCRGGGGGYRIKSCSLCLPRRSHAQRASSPCLPPTATLIPGILLQGLISFPFLERLFKYCYIYSAAFPPCLPACLAPSLPAAAAAAVNISVHCIHKCENFDLQVQCFPNTFPKYIIFLHISDWRKSSGNISTKGGGV